jgi:hypothetical protein
MCNKWDWKTGNDMGGSWYIVWHMWYDAVSIISGTGAATFTAIVVMQLNGRW